MSDLPSQYAEEVENTSNPRLQQPSTTRWDSLVLKISFKNLIQIVQKSASSCNTVMVRCLHSAKASFKRVRNQIQKGADPERAARRSYENTCDYFELMNKRILIQQRALACHSKSVAHILQRELYTMGNTGLLRREAEMTRDIRNWGTCLFGLLLFSSLN